MNENLLSETRKNIILSLADHDMNVSEVARNLYMHRNTAVYNIEQIQSITGKNPMNFYDLHDLVCMVKKEMMEKGKLDEEEQTESASC